MQQIRWCCKFWFIILPYYKQWTRLRSCKNVLQDQSIISATSTWFYICNALQDNTMWTVGNTSMITYIITLLWAFILIYLVHRGRISLHTTGTITQHSTTVYSWFRYALPPMTQYKLCLTTSNARSYLSLSPACKSYFTMQIHISNRDL